MRMQSMKDHTLHTALRQRWTVPSSQNDIWLYGIFLFPLTRCSSWRPLLIMLIHSSQNFHTILPKLSMKLLAMFYLLPEAIFLPPKRLNEKLHNYAMLSNIFIFAKILKNVMEFVKDSIYSPDLSFRETFV